jgi:hypothetical protein
VDEGRKGGDVWFAEEGWGGGAEKPGDVEVSVLRIDSRGAPPGGGLDVCSSLAFEEEGQPEWESGAVGWSQSCCWSLGWSY